VSPKLQRTRKKENLLSPAVMTEANPNPLGRIVSHEWKNPEFSLRKMKLVRAMIGKKEVTTINQ